MYSVIKWRHFMKMAYHFMIILWLTNVYPGEKCDINCAHKWIYSVYSKRFQTFFLGVSQVFLSFLNDTRCTDLAKTNIKADAVEKLMLEEIERYFNVLNATGGKLWRTQLTKLTQDYLVQSPHIWWGGVCDFLISHEDTDNLCELV